MLERFSYFGAVVVLGGAAPALATSIDPLVPYYEVSGSLRYREYNPVTKSFDLKTKSVTDLGTYDTSTGSNPATLIVGATPSPFLQLDITGGYNQHSATLRYSYRVYLPSIAGAPVEIAQLTTIEGHYRSTTMNGPSTVSVRTGIYSDLSGTPQSLSQTLYSAMSASQSFSLTGAGALLQAGYLLNGVSYDVYGGNLALGLSTLAYGAGRVFVDPIIAANTPGLQQAGYSGVGALVRVPDGFGNPGVPGPVVTAVPEPAQWLFLLFGFGLVGTALRARSAKLLGVN